MANQVPNIRLDFSGSSRTAANANTSLAQARAAFSDMADRHLKKQQNKAEQERFERQQSYVEGAGERAVQAEQAQYELENQRRAEKYAAASGIVDQAANNFTIAPENLAVIEQDPRYLEMLPEEQEEFKEGIKRYMQQKQNIDLHADPDQIAAETRAKGRELGWSTTDIEDAVKRNLEEFKFLDPVTAAAIREQNSVNQAQVATLLGKNFGSNNGSGSSTSGRNGNKYSGANARANAEFTDKWLERINADEAEGFLSKVGNAVNPLSDEDVTRENIAPLLAAFAEAGIEAPAALQAIEGDGLVSDGEYNTSWFDGNNTAEGILKSDPERFEKLVASARAIQNSGSSNSSASGSGNSQNISLGQRLGLLRASQQDTANSNSQINQNIGPRQKSLSERRKIYMDFLEEKTGISLKDLEKPTKKQQQEIKNAVINVKEGDKNVPEEVIEESKKLSLKEEQQEKAVQESEIKFLKLREQQRNEVVGEIPDYLKKGSKQEKESLSRVREISRKKAEEEYNKKVKSEKLLAKRELENKTKSALQEVRYLEYQLKLGRNQYKKVYGIETEEEAAKLLEDFKQQLKELKSQQ